MVEEKVWVGHAVLRSKFSSTVDGVNWFCKVFKNEKQSRIGHKRNVTN